MAIGWGCVSGSQREQARRHGSGMLADLLGERERTAYGGIARSVPELADVDAIWYVRSKVAFLLEVEWTAMLGEPLLRRHTRIGTDEKLIRSSRSPPSGPISSATSWSAHRSCAAMEEYGWHIVKWDHLRTFLAAEKPDSMRWSPCSVSTPSSSAAASRCRCRSAAEGRARYATPPSDAGPHTGPLDPPPGRHTTHMTDDRPPWTPWPTVSGRASSSWTR